MKKIFAITALVAAMVACNDTKQAADEKKVAGDSLTNAANEAAAASDSAMKAGTDSANAVIDTTKK